MEYELISLPIEPPVFGLRLGSNKTGVQNSALPCMFTGGRVSPPLINKII